MTLQHYAMIAAGSALGGMARYWLGLHAARWFGAAFPWGTMMVNVLGSFLIGYASNWAHVQPVRFLVMIGLCGGFTTFSSFSLENLALLRQGDWPRAAAYIAMSVAVCLAAVWLGSAAGRWQQE
jgi:CrcB protein